MSRMTSRRNHQLRSSLAGGVLGLLALILVTAVLSGAIAAVQANRTIETLASQLTDARGQIDALREDNDQLDIQNLRLLTQNTEQHDQLDALIRYLRRHGLPVPKIITATPETTTKPDAEVSQGPKAPAPSPSPSLSPSPSPSPVPGSPAPTPTPMPPGPSPGLGIPCDLIPILCLP